MLDFSKVEAKELEVVMLLNELRDTLGNDLRSIKSMHGVKSLGKGCMEVTYKTVKEHNNLSSEYYNIELQVKYILNILNKTNTVSEFKNKMQELITKKFIVVSGNKYMINNLILERLQDALGIKIVGKKK